MTTLYLIRHSESSPDRDLPESSWPLSAKGELQFIKMVKPLSLLKPNWIYSSPYRRAFDSLKPLSDYVNLPIQTDKRLRERKLSKRFLDNFNFFKVMKETWKDFDFALEDAETGNMAKARVLQFIEEKCKVHLGEVIFVSSHGNLIGLVLNSIDKDFGFSQWQKMKTPDVFKLIVSDKLNWDKDFLWEDVIRS